MEFDIWGGGDDEVVVVGKSVIVGSGGTASISIGFFNKF